MQYHVLWTLLTTVLALNTPFGEAYNILGVFPTFSKSHYIAGGALMRGLAADGHNVSVISPYPNKTPLPNFRDIRVLGVGDAIKELLPKTVDLQNVTNPLTQYMLYTKILSYVTNYTLTHPTMTELLENKDEHFDVVIIETTFVDALLGLGQHFKAPIVAFSPLGSSLGAAELVGTPVPMSYVPNLLMPFTDRMSFTERIINTLVYAVELITSKIYASTQEEIYNAVFKNANKPSYQEVLKSVSFVLLNQHFSTSIPRPYVPNMVEVGGLHINRDEPKQLPDDIREFVEGAEHGVVYFSFGTNVLSSELPFAVRDGILRALGQLKQRVLWKWEEPVLPGKPDNVLVKKWFPQDDVLGHPNVKLFITHGGMLSLSEAIYHGLPIIGVPFFGDQSLNMARAGAQGLSLTLEYSNLTETSLTWALTEILGNPKYAEKAQEMSLRYRDQPMKPLDLAKYWVEYVARHKGAPHIKSAGLELSWFAYFSLDVFVVLIGSIVLWNLLVWIVVVRFCCRRTSKEAPSKLKLKKY